jgi:hypothetical protein
MKYGSLNLLEPSGPHRACYGTGLPVPFTIIKYKSLVVEVVVVIVAVKLVVVVVVIVVVVE